MHEELQKQVDLRTLKQSLDEEGKEGKSKVFCTRGWMMEHWKKSCQKEGFGFDLQCIVLKRRKSH